MEPPQPPTATSPLIGRIIAEKYEVLSLIASGGAGDVYKVRHIEIDNIRAAKVLRMSLRGKDDPLLRLQREARTLCKLKHPNVVSVHAVDLDPNAGFIMIMDYVEGQSLSDFIKQNPELPPATVRKLAIDICLGLQEVHNAGVLHRDLKPNNVMIRTHGETISPVLIDFGLAKFQDSQQILTQSGAFLGTPLYVSPEQCLSKPMDVRSDIYSFGCLLYELCTGRPPFTASTAIELMSMHVGVEPEPLSVVRPAMAEFDDVIMTSLRKDPHERFANVAGLMSALKQEPGFVAPKQRRRVGQGLPDLERLTLWLAVICIGLLVAAGVMYIQTQYSKVAVESAQPAQDRGSREPAMAVLIRSISFNEDTGNFGKAFKDRWKLAKLYDQEGKYDDASFHYEKLIKICDDNQLPRFPELDQGVNQLRQGYCAGAQVTGLRVFGRDSHTNKPEVLTFIAHCENAMHLYQDAYATALLAIQASKGSPGIVRRKANYALAKACIGLNRFREADGAVVQIEEHLALSPQEPGGSLTELRAIVDRGLRRDSARTALKQTVEILEKRQTEPGLSQDEKNGAAATLNYVRTEYERVGNIKQ